MYRCFLAILMMMICDDIFSLWLLRLRLLISTGRLDRALFILVAEIFIAEV
jgi:hypothetical protein